MKRLILYCLLFACKLSFAQSDTMQLYQAYTSFSDRQKAEWTAFENNWHFDKYPKLQSEAGIRKLTCRDCGSFYADLYMTIDKDGKVSKAAFITGRLCGNLLTPALCKGFIDSLNGASFQQLKNKSFIARFGHILKC